LDLGEEELFTDGPVTPTRVETLLDLLRGLPHNKKIDRDMLYQLLQPEGVPEIDPKKRDAAKDTVRAARELELIEETADKLIKIKFARNDSRAATNILLDALDLKVLASTDVEPYFAKFYSYILSLDKQGVIDKSHDDWAREFERDVYGHRPSNPFNKEKLFGLHRWMGYLGLGWYDSYGIFQPNPYERLLRRLKTIFSGRTKKLDSDEFMSRLADSCPELDAGAIFKQANKHYNSEGKVCTLGLSHALVDLHLDGYIELFCPADSHGWSIELADPPSARLLQSGRIATVALLKTT
jgi:hypothetical protein